MSVQRGADAAPGRAFDVRDPRCPSRAALDHVTSRWAVIVFDALRDGPVRFNELGRRVGGVSDKMLAQTLRTREADGHVRRTDHGGTPPHVDYALTERGVATAELVSRLVDWIEVDVTPAIVAGPDQAG